ncbi:MAG: hypothetical protein IKH04_04585, partial [Kiritimatiellae bacterium]|nr:hypothetical protein [Kiritimatiellia bacterium]
MGTKLRTYSSATAIAAGAMAAFAFATQPVLSHAAAFAAGDTSLEGGKIAMTYDAEDGSAVASLVATPAAGETLLIEGDAMTFANGATIALAAEGGLVFSNAVVTLGALSLTRADGAYVHVSVPSGMTGGTYVTFAEGTAYEGWEPVAFLTGAGAIAPGRFTPRGTGANGFIWANFWDGMHTWSARFQRRDNGGNAQFRLNTVVRSPFGAYLPTSDLWNKTLPSADYVWYYSDENYVSGGTYGGLAGKLEVTDAVFRKVGASDVGVRFDGGLSLGGALDIAAGVRAVVGIGLEGATLNHPVTGAGSLRVEPTTSVTQMAWAGDVAYDGYLPGEWTVVAENKYLGGLTNIVGYMHGKSLFPKKATADLSPSYALFFTNNTEFGACQFQVHNNTIINCVKAQFRQNGANVEAKLYAAGFKYVADGYAVGDDMPETVTGDNGYNKRNISTSLASGDYGIENLTFYFDDTAEVKVDLAAANEMRGASALELSGNGGVNLVATASDLGCAPTNGVVTIGEGASLILGFTPTSATGGLRTGLSGGAVALDLQGGTVVQPSTISYGGFNKRQRVFADGGTVLTEKITRNYAQVYLTRLELANGATLSGNPVATVDGENSLWRVTGAAPCRFDAGLCVVTDTAGLEKGYHIRFDIEDVTGDDAVDATLSKFVSANTAFNNNDGKYGYGHFEKTGAGTLRLDGDYTPITQRSVIFDGAFMLGESGITDATSLFALDGGTLSAAAGTANTLGSLVVGENGGGIALGEGATLSFADSSDTAWTAGGNVVVSGFAEGAIRFGSDESGLTNEQRRRFAT